jgi:hypothetical protein
MSTENNLTLPSEFFESYAEVNRNCKPLVLQYSNPELLNVPWRGFPLLQVFSVWGYVTTQAVPQLRRLVAGFPPRGPGSSPGQVMWDF